MESQCVFSFFTYTFPCLSTKSIDSPLNDAMLTTCASCIAELQGHAIKNQDLLVASGAVSLKGSEGLSAVDEDIEAATAVCLYLVVRGPPLGQTG